MKLVKQLFAASRVKSNRLILAAVSLVVAFVCGCAGGRQVPLRVGITPDYPPMVFKYNGQIAGAEVDMGRALAGQLK